MKTISILEFRHNTKKFIQMAEQGQRMIMTYRGKPVCRIEPLDSEKAEKNDPFYNIDELATSTEKSLTNEEMDAIIYGQ